MTHISLQKNSDAKLYSITAAFEKSLMSLNYITASYNLAFLAKGNPFRVEIDFVYQSKEVVEVNMCSEFRFNLERPVLHFFVAESGLLFLFFFDFVPVLVNLTYIMTPALSLLFNDPLEMIFDFREFLENEIFCDFGFCKAWVLHNPWTFIQYGSGHPAVAVGEVDSYNLKLFKNLSIELK